MTPPTSRTTNMPKLPPGREKKTTRSFMIEDSLWQAFKAAAAENGETPSEALRDQIAAYNRRTAARSRKATATSDE